MNDIVLEIIKFFKPILAIVGYIKTLVAVIVFLWVVYQLFTGLLPVLYKIGMGISKRKIAIFSSTEFNSLKDMLIDSKIFKEKNIIQINRSDINKAAERTFFLVHWKDFQDKLPEIMQIKKDSTALIVYAPQNEGFIPPLQMRIINDQRNTIVVNFRGRLLNDILVSLITTGYDRG